MNEQLVHFFVSATREFARCWLKAFPISGFSRLVGGGRLPSPFGFAGCHDTRFALSPSRMERNPALTLVPPLQVSARCAKKLSAQLAPQRYKLQEDPYSSKPASKMRSMSFLSNPCPYKLVAEAEKHDPQQTCSPSPNRQAPACSDEMGARIRSDTPKEYEG